MINRAGVGRYSIPFFYDPDFDARFASLPEFSAGEFLLAKFNKFYKYRKELSEPAAWTRACAPRHARLRGYPRLL